MINLRNGLFEASTPEYTVTCRRGGGTKAAMREMSASGASPMLHVPSDQGRLNSKARCAPGDASVSQQMQPLVGQRGAQDVPAQHFLPLLIVRRDTAGGVQVEGPNLRAEVTLGLGAGIGLKRHAHQRALLRRAGGRRARGRIYFRKKTLPCK
jgi:hypothetical protein